MTIILKVLSISGIILGIILTSQKVIEIFNFSVVNARVKKVELSQGECRRRSGKAETCTKARFFVTLNNLEHTESFFEQEVSEVPLKEGDEIKVFSKKSNPSEINVELLREGWKTPLSITVLSGFFLLLILLRGNKK